MRSLNTDARAIFTAALIPSPQIIGLKAHDAQAALFGHHYKGPGNAKIEDVRQIINAVGKHFDYDESIVLLQRLGANSINELWIGAYDKIIDFGKACIEYDYPPSGSWDDCKPRVIEEPIEDDEL